jgi:hypothetical protein
VHPHGLRSAVFQPCPPSPVEVTFDVPIELDLYGYAPLRGYYVAQVWPTFFEMDDNALDEWQETSESAEYLADDTPGDGDYTYLVSYRRCHVAAHKFCNP